MWCFIAQQSKAVHSKMGFWAIETCGNTWLQLHPGYPPDMKRATSPSSCKRSSPDQRLESSWPLNLQRWSQICTGFRWGGLACLWVHCTVVGCSCLRWTPTKNFVDEQMVGHKFNILSTSIKEDLKEVATTCFWSERDDVQTPEIA